MSRCEAQYSFMTRVQRSCQKHGVVVNTLYVAIAASYSVAAWQHVAMPCMRWSCGVTSFNDCQAAWFASDVDSDVDSGANDTAKPLCRVVPCLCAVLLLSSYGTHVTCPHEQRAGRRGWCIASFLVVVQCLCGG
jgi:hypothetical protein